MDREMHQSATEHREFTFSSLYDWERYLDPCFTDIRLLGELSLTRDELEELAYYIRDLLRRHGFTQGTRLLKTRYARAFLVFLAHTAARNEERGFWEIVAREVGVPNPGGFFSPKHHWGRLFIELTEQLGLETFPEMESGHRYVTAIRLHGGIPAYSLPDFFDNVLLPAVDRPQYTGLEVPELIEQLLQRSAVQYFVDSPVRYFLEYGGETARRFFARCLEMARAWREQGRIPSARELGLPRYVVRIFQEYVEGSLRTPQGKRLRPPRLHLEPYDPETLLRLELPFQPVDATEKHRQYIWEVHHHDGHREHTLKRLPVTVQRRGGSLVTEATEFAFHAGPGQIRVEFLARSGKSSEVRGSWFFDLAVDPEKQPLLAFRVRSGRPVRPGDDLPADLLWLILPEHIRVDVRPQGYLLTEAFSLHGDWFGWKLEEWDLTHTRVLRLQHIDAGETCYSLSLQTEQHEPRLSGEGQPDRILTETETGPFFVGQPPQLWLPRLTGQTVEDEARSWKLQLRVEHRTQHGLPSTGEIPLSELSPQPDETGFTVSLADLLGEKAAGIYTAEVKGPRHFRKGLTFRIWPAFTVDDLAPYYLPGPEGAEPTVFHVQIPAEHELRPADPGDVQVSTTETPGRYRVEVPPWATKAELILVQSTSAEGEIQVPIALPVVRPRWILQLDEDTFEGTTPLEFPIDKVLQSRRTYLYLIWDRAQTLPQARLWLRDLTVASQEILQEAELKPPRHGNRIAFDLARLRDTLATQTNASNLELALVVDQSGQTTPVPLLYLRRELGLIVALLERVDEEHTILHWEAAHRLRNRRVRLWSAWRPWEPGREHRIPDDVEPDFPGDAPGSGSFLLPEPLKSGPYWVALRTAPSWEPLHMPPFPTEDSILAECDVVNPKHRLEIIDSQLFEGELSPFLAAFERACIFHLQNETALRDREIAKAIKALDSADSYHIAALHGWLQTLGTDQIVKLRIQMYQPHFLIRLFEGKYPAEIVESYMAGFTETPLIDPDSARLILKNKHILREWRDYATTLLTNSDQLKDVQIILKDLREQIISETIALDLLAERGEQALTHLYETPSDPLRDCLLSSLSVRIRSPRVVRPGIWMRTEAGWGQVQAIYTPTGHTLPFLILDEQGNPLEPALIRVVLERSLENLQAEIDLVNRTIHVQGVDEVICCAKEGCPGFVALHQEEVVETHCRKAHGGLGPAFRRTGPKWCYRHRPCFTWDIQHPYA